MSGISASSFSPGRKAGCPDVSSGRQPPSLLPFQAVRLPSVRTSPAAGLLSFHIWLCGRLLFYPPFFAVRVLPSLVLPLLTPEPALSLPASDLF